MSDPEAQLYGAGGYDEVPESKLNREWLDREVPRDPFGIGRELSSSDLKTYEPGELQPPR